MTKHGIFISHQDSWEFTAILAGLFLLIFGIGEILFHVFKIKANSTRQIVHLSSGLLTLSFPFLLVSHWMVLLLTLSFLLILVGSKFLNMLPSINGVKRKSVGSWLFPIAVYISFLAQEEFGLYRVFFVIMAILAVADPIAAAVGSRYGKQQTKGLLKGKSYIGTTVFFVSAGISLWLLNTGFSLSLPTWVVFLTISVATLAELLGKNGWDNLTIPLSIIGVFLTLNLVGI